MGRGRGPSLPVMLGASPLAVVMLNLYPYNVGHVMVAPRRHLRSIAQLTPEEAVEVTAYRVEHQVESVGQALSNGWVGTGVKAAMAVAGHFMGRR